MRGGSRLVRSGDVEKGRAGISQSKLITNMFSSFGKYIFPLSATS
jgi:hypothetical protein